MRFLSLFSGIEAASAAWLPLGWECVGVAEIEPFACAVLASRYRDVPNLGDVLAPDFLQRAVALRPDVLVGGPPCQDFSIAGLRAGLDGARGNLSLRWVEVVRAIRPTYAVTENVPGWLSVNRGHAFGAFLAGLVGHDTALVPPRNCGGRWTNAGMVAGPLGRVAWRVMDAQYFGLAQRRQRVFAVFCPRDGADPAAVLFEPASLRWDTPPRREAGTGVAALTSCGVGTCGADDNQAQAGHLVARNLNSHHGRYDGGSDTLVAHALRADGGDAGDLAPTMRAVSHSGSHANAGGQLAAMQGTAVRRLMPEECEALQGFPRGYTAIPYRARPAADGNRYRALGNSMAVPVVAWIGRAILASESRTSDDH